MIATCPVFITFLSPLSITTPARLRLFSWPFSHVLSCLFFFLFPRRGRFRQEQNRQLARLWRNTCTASKGSSPLFSPPPPPLRFLLHSSFDYSFLFLLFFQALHLFVSVGRLQASHLAYSLEGLQLSQTCLGAHGKIRYIVTSTSVLFFL